MAETRRKSSEIRELVLGIVQKSSEPVLGKDIIEQAKFNPAHGYQVLKKLTDAKVLKMTGNPGKQAYTVAKRVTRRAAQEKRVRAAAKRRRSNGNGNGHSNGHANGNGATSSPARQLVEVCNTIVKTAAYLSALETKRDALVAQLEAE